MTTDSTRNLLELTALLARNALVARPRRKIADDALQLAALARTLGAIAIRECNGYAVEVTPKGPIGRQDAEKREARDCRAAERATASARVIASAYGATILTNGDPRGYALFVVGLTDPATGRPATNDLGERGFGL